MAALDDKTLIALYSGCPKTTWTGAGGIMRQAADEIVRLRLALEEIAGSHCPDQPAAYEMSESDWAMRHIGTMRLIAKNALEGKSADTE